MKICPSCNTKYTDGESFCPNDASRLITPSEMPQTAPATEDPLVGKILSDRYRVLRRIGEGGMGMVYETEHVVIEKRVALKVLRDDYSSRPDVVERFRQEAKSASRIGHQHIVDISDFGQTPTGQSYFVMELLDGEDLAGVLGREGTLPPQRAVHILLQCCRALGAAHAKGIVHRDMKPENIFLTRREGTTDFVKIVDFGIAKMSDIETSGAPGRKLTKTGMIFGTPEYMSPEQAAGKALDHRVDIYAMGVILFEMLSGRVPFVGDSFMGILTQHMFEPIPSIREVNPAGNCPASLEAVIRTALEKDPSKRFQTMDDLANALTGALSGSFKAPLPVEAMAPKIAKSPAVTLPDFSVSDSLERAGSSSHKGWIGGVVGVGVLGILGVIGYVALKPSSQTATQNVERKSPPSSTLSEVTPPPETRERSVAALTGVIDAGPAPAQDAIASIALTINTIPAGARLWIDESVVCEASPCTVQTPAGKSIRVRARKGTKSAMHDLQPTQAMMIELALRGSAEPEARRTSREGAAEKTSGPAHPQMDDLKVPDQFR